MGDQREVRRECRPRAFGWPVGVFHLELASRDTGRKRRSKEIECLESGGLRAFTYFS